MVSLNIFDERYRDTLTPFSSTHIITLVVMFFLFLLFTQHQKTLQVSRNDKIFRYSMAFFLLTLELIYEVWIVLKKGFSIDMLPLHLCDIINILTILALLTNNRKLASVVYYWALLGAVLAFISPSICYGPPHFRFFHYFLLHFGLVLSNLYLVLTDVKLINKKENNKSCLILFCSSFIIFLLDLLLDQNWMYMVKSPVERVNDFFPFPIYTVLWISMNIIIINIFYFVTKFFLRKDLTIIEQ